MYPDANIWVIGHSLGGALASLLGITFGAPVVTFEPPGERMAAKRLHLPSPVCHQFRIHIYLPILTGFPVALNAPHHTRVAHGRPDRNGHLHRFTFDLRNSWVCDGKPVSLWKHHRIRHNHEPLLVVTPHDPPNRNRYRKYTFKALARCGGARPRSASFQEAGRLHSAFYVFLFSCRFPDLLWQDCFQWEYGNFTL